MVCLIFTKNKTLAGRLGLQQTLNIIGIIVDKYLPAMCCGGLIRCVNILILRRLKMVKVAAR